MPMKLAGNIVVDAPRDEVWNRLFDTEVLKRVLNRIPGITVERLVQIAEDKYEATATIGVAMVKGKYDGVITVLEKRAPEYVKFHGEGKGGGNWTGGDMALTLADQEGKTAIAYEGLGNVNGPLASVGQRMIDMVGKQFIQNGARSLAEEFGKPPAASQPDAPARPAAPDQPTPPPPA